MSLNVDLLRESFAKAATFGDDLPTHFYQTLFLQYPEAKELFKHANMTLQRDLLVRSLNFVVDNLEDTDSLTSYLEALGSRHARYGTKEEHFVWVGHSLLATFSHFFAEAWTPDLQEQWEMALDFISANMMRGLQRAKQYQSTESENTSEETSTVPTGSVDELHAQASAAMALQIELPENLRRNIRQQIRGAIQQAVAKAIQEEIESALQEELNQIDLSQLFQGKVRKAA